jgi:hypothetical protein
MEIAKSERAKIANPDRRLQGALICYLALCHLAI